MPKANKIDSVSDISDFNIESVIQKAVEAATAAVRNELANMKDLIFDKLNELDERVKVCIMDIRKVNTQVMEERLLAVESLVSTQMQQLKNPVVQPVNTTESSALAVKSDVFTDSVNITNRTEPDAGSSSWACLASSINDNDFVVVRPKRSLIKAAERPPATAHSASLTTNVRVTGNRMSSTSGDAKVKGVPRRLTAFVSRLHKDTTEDDLCDMLQSAGIFDVKCTKLQSRDGRVFSTAAFRVSVSAAQRDDFYNPDIWPCGTELRDWVFYPPTRPISTENSA